MSIRKVNFVSGEYYHIYNRGNSKQIIFHDAEDYKRFMVLMYVCNSADNIKIGNIDRSNNDPFYFKRENSLVSLGAYVLMPNHFHLLLTEKVEGGISKFMQKLSTAYVMYYNQKHERSGSLFEGKFKSQHADSDRYLKYLFGYIHLNPVKLVQKDWKEKGIRDKKKAMDFLNKYFYSSFLDFLGEERRYSKILNTEDFPKYFKNKKDFLKNILEWLSYGEV